MKAAVRTVVLIILVCLISLLSGCGVLNDEETGSEAEDHTPVIDEKQPDDEEIVWDEVSENGVDESLLIMNTDKETLAYIAQELQDLCEEINEKGEEDKNYWLTGKWYSDATESKQYENVVSLGNKAMKPLFLILYKSEDSGMYEWICSKALDEISGFDFSMENNGVGWRNSDEFLEMFIERILAE